MSLPKILAAAEPVEGGFRAGIGEDWLQGRTAYGGLSAALAYEAAKRQGDRLPPLRSAQISFIGPVAGTVTATARLERQGKNAAFVRADLTTGHGPGLSAMFVFMRAMESHVDLREGERPDYPRPASIEPPEAVPSFVQQFEIGPVEPTPGGASADIVRWFRLKDRADLDPMTELVLMGDGLPPAATAVMARSVTISSITWLFNILAAAPMTEDGWWLLRAASDYARDGASSQDMSVWNARGDLVARGMQAVAIFG